MRVRLDLGYDGTDFSGWAKQPGRRTVQGAFEDAIATVFGLSSAAQLTVAGRTDAGVHARGQVAHVDLPIEAWEAKRDAAIRQLRGLLPADVRLVALGVAPTGFDARFSAISRSYTYRISDAPAGVDPLRRRDVVWHKKGLDAAAMNRAAAALLGEHDFAAFCKRREGASTIRTLTQFSWQREEDDLLTASVVADAFCHNMVRSLVGACIPVGEGRRDMSWVSATLGGAERSSEVTVMPAHGLTLEEITYPTHADLARRAREARTFRVLK